MSTCEVIELAGAQPEKDQVLKGISAPMSVNSLKYLQKLNWCKWRTYCT